MAGECLECQVVDCLYVAPIVAGKQCLNCCVPLIAHQCCNKTDEKVVGAQSGEAFRGEAGAVRGAMLELKQVSPHLSDAAEKPVDFRRKVAQFGWPARMA